MGALYMYMYMYVCKILYIASEVLVVYTRSSNKTIITMAVNKILLHVHVRSKGLVCYTDTGTSLIRLPIVLAGYTQHRKVVL